jgi:hypothetical protein
MPPACMCQSGAEAVAAEALEHRPAGDPVIECMGVTAKTYTHILADERELDYAELLDDLLQKVSQLPS